MPNASDIIAVPGEDPSVLGRENGDPSGFEQMGYGERERADFLDFCKTVMNETCRSASTVLQDTMQSAVAIYVQPYDHDRQVAATTLYAMENVEALTAMQTMNGVEYLTGLRPAFSQAKGLRVHAAPGEHRTDPLRWRRNLTHETIHILVENVLSFSQSVNEGFVNALEKRLTTDDTDMYDGTVSATTGMRCPVDFSSEHHIQASKILPYLAGPIGLRFLSTEKLWDICGAVWNKIQDEGFKGEYGHFNEAVHSTLSKDDARRLLGLPFVKALEPGLQQFAFPYDKQSSVFFSTAIFTPNPAFRGKRPDGSFDTYYGSWSAPPETEMNLRLFRKKGNEPVKIMRYTLMPRTRLSFTEIMEGAEIHGLGNTCRQDIHHTSVSLGVLPPMNLKPPKQN